MTLNFDTDQPVVGLGRQRALIQAVLEASSADETRWLEWKSRLDVSKSEGAFAVSKAILGFANRMPDAAAQWAEGHAYLLVGVEEKVLHGVPTHDVEKVDSWLRRYIGGFDRYQFTYVPFDNGEGTRHVMLVDVFPPRWGDPIHTLRKNYDKYFPGAIFHRNAGKTEYAGPAEIEALTERARRVGQRLDVGVDPAGATVAVLKEFDAVRERLLHTRREELRRQLARPAARPHQFASLMGQWPDTRSPQEFLDEVEEYLRDVRVALKQAAAHMLREVGAPLRLKVVNPGETFLAQVEVVLSLPHTVEAHLVDDDQEVDWPQPPATFGAMKTMPIAGLISPMRPQIYRPATVRYPEIEYEDGRTIIRYPPVDLRPNETARLDPIALLSAREEREAIVCEWRATATNVSGRVQRTMSLPAQALEIDIQVPENAVID
ncbi:helix-turn-helix domain-containing protein [Streptomyces sp. NPDC091280]|uniref:AlbA family DNA-binding domain-containing protein n=1 Tax=Streptomyces sp. NPDC091280 TaxID=3365984 RepID=UPI00380577D7